MNDVLRIKELLDLFNPYADCKNLYGSSDKEFEELSDTRYKAIRSGAVLNWTVSNNRDLEVFVNACVSEIKTYKVNSDFDEWNQLKKGKWIFATGLKIASHLLFYSLSFKWLESCLDKSIVERLINLGNSKYNAMFQAWVYEFVKALHKHKYINKNRKYFKEVINEIKGLKA